MKYFIISSQDSDTSKSIEIKKENVDETHAPVIEQPEDNNNDENEVTLQGNEDAEMIHEETPSLSGEEPPVDECDTGAFIGKLDEVNQLNGQEEEQLDEDNNLETQLSPTPTTPPNITCPVDDDDEDIQNQDDLYSTFAREEKVLTPFPSLDDGDGRDDLNDKNSDILNQTQVDDIMNEGCGNDSVGGVAVVVGGGDSSIDGNEGN